MNPQNNDVMTPQHVLQMRQLFDNCVTAFENHAHATDPDLDCCSLEIASDVAGSNIPDTYNSRARRQLRRALMVLRPLCHIDHFYNNDLCAEDDFKRFAVCDCVERSLGVVNFLSERHNTHLASVPDSQIQEQLTSICYGGALPHPPWKVTMWIRPSQGDAHDAPLVARCARLDAFLTANPVCPSDSRSTRGNNSSPSRNRNRRNHRTDGTPFSGPRPISEPTYSCIFMPLMWQT